MNAKGSVLIKEVQGGSTEKEVSALKEVVDRCCQSGCIEEKAYILHIEGIVGRVHSGLRDPKDEEVYGIWGELLSYLRPEIRLRL